MTELIITEKPSSAKKIAEALADGRPVQKKNKQFEKDFWKPFTVISRKELGGKNEFRN